MTAAENVALSIDVCGRPAGARERQASQLLDAMGLFGAVSGIARRSSRAVNNARRHRRARWRTIRSCCWRTSRRATWTSRTSGDIMALLKQLMSVTGNDHSRHARRAAGRDDAHRTITLSDGTIVGESRS